MEDRFKLELRVSIVKVEVTPTTGYERWLNDRLEVTDTKNLGSMDFAGVARVLQRFYAVAQELTQEVS